MEAAGAPMQVELIDIHKHYGAVKANDGVSLTVAPGELHGILGENGAGKSTLMKILAGFTARTSGSVRIDGGPVEYRTTAEAIQRLNNLANPNALSVGQKLLIPPSAPSP